MRNILDESCRENQNMRFIKYTCFHSNTIMLSSNLMAKSFGHQAIILIAVRILLLQDGGDCTRGFRQHGETSTSFE
jgi:hypothetical protein